MVEGAAYTGIDFSLPAFNASISGTIRSTATGELLDAMVQLYLGDTAIATRSGSSYTFSGVAAGTYRIKVSAPGHIAEWFGNACDPCGAHGTAVIVASGDTRAGIDFSLEAAVAELPAVVTKHPRPDHHRRRGAARRWHRGADGVSCDPTTRTRSTALPPGTYVVRASDHVI